MSGCIACGRSLCDECPNPTKDGKCCCSVEQASLSGDEEIKSTGRRGRTLKTEGLSISAGRKRAAKLYPIEKEEPCEWRGKANCGGGRFPITGCFNGFQQNRHHGPVKDTSHNDRKNIHRICAKCHNTWHAKNDGVYIEADFALLPHQPRDATPMEIVEGN